MPLRLCAGISKKLGLPRYSSIGATCQLEIELADHVGEGKVLHEQIDRVYALCTRAVDEELAHYLPGAADVRDAERQPAPRLGSGNGRGAGLANGNGRVHADDHHDAHASGDGNAQGEGNRSGTAAGPCDGRSASAASARQQEFLQSLARKIAGLDEDALETLSRRLCGCGLAELSRQDASRLIGTLEEVLDGEMDLDRFLGPDAA